MGTFSGAALGYAGTVRIMRRAVRPLAEIVCTSLAVKGRLMQEDNRRIQSHSTRALKEECCDDAAFLQDLDTGSLRREWVSFPARTPERAFQFSTIVIDHR